jgi:hypothetical protein
MSACLTEITVAACPRKESGTVVPRERQRRAVKWRAVIENECTIEAAEDARCIMHGDGQYIWTTEYAL